MRVPTPHGQDGAAHADARHKGLPRAIDDDLWTASVAPEDVSRRGFRRQECDRGSPQRAAQYPEHHARIASDVIRHSDWCSAMHGYPVACGPPNPCLFFPAPKPPLPAPPPTSGIFINGAPQVGLSCPSLSLCRRTGLQASCISSPLHVENRRRINASMDPTSAGTSHRGTVRAHSADRYEYLSLQPQVPLLERMAAMPHGLVSLGDGRCSS